MKISIITTSFNSAKTIRDTLLSVSTQKYPDLEHIVVDGGSTDATLDIVAEFPHVAKVISENDQGIYEAMNKGISVATGEVIGFLNSDDVYVDNLVTQHIANTIIEKNVDSVYGDLYYFNFNKENQFKIIRRWIAKSFKRNNFLYGWMPPHPTFYAKKKVFSKFGQFNLSLKSSADYELMLRFLYKFKITTHYIEKVLVYMRMGGKSNQSLKNRILANLEDKKAWQINDLNPKFFTTILKPLSKISQLEIFPSKIINFVPIIRRKLGRKVIFWGKQIHEQNSYKEPVFPLNSAIISSQRSEEL